ncbi:MAG: LL-diaminopimelate aminotransferase [Candidatus Omnitrophica bacterium]|nr:LL-diaminopimelate aminotransferase [Candidatus Omnitrophota bacterium]MCM8827853.1 LL-diaminopimelate aminotransferase [Candidatus Omnitrophota bacterium]
MFQISEKMQKLPPYLFAEIDKKKKQLIAQGRQVISFGVGDPDMPTPERIVEAMRKAVKDPSVHRYPFGKGRSDFRKAIADYYRKYSDVDLDYEKEICVLIGSKEGIAHFPFAFVNPGDITLVPEPGYPVYQIGTILAGGIPYFMPLKEENNFLPDLGKIPSEILDRAKIMYLNYPNNPTAACADIDFLKEAISFCRKRGIIIVYDAAYHELYFEGKRPTSFLSIPGAKDTGIEIHSLSKTYNMTGWRIGWACGNEELVSAIATLKENIDSGTFEAIQIAGVECLSGPQEDVEQMRSIYQKRRDILVDGLKNLGFNVKIPQSTFYLWLVVGCDSFSFTEKLLMKANIIVTPGVGFGPSGEGYVRFALTIDEAKIKLAIEKMRTLINGG